MEKFIQTAKKEKSEAKLQAKAVRYVNQFNQFNSVNSFNQFKTIHVSSFVVFKEIKKVGAATDIYYLINNTTTNRIICCLFLLLQRPNCKGNQISADLFE